MAATGIDAVSGTFGGYGGTSHADGAAVVITLSGIDTIVLGSLGLHGASADFHISAIGIDAHDIARGSHLTVGEGDVAIIRIDAIVIGASGIDGAILGSKMAATGIDAVSGTFGGDGGISHADGAALVIDLVGIDTCVIGSLGFHLASADFHIAALGIDAVVRGVYPELASLLAGALAVDADGVAIGIDAVIADGAFLRADVHHGAVLQDEVDVAVGGAKLVVEADVALGHIPAFGEFTLRAGEHGVVEAGLRGAVGVQIIHGSQGSAECAGGGDTVKPFTKYGLHFHAHCGSAAETCQLV